MANSGLQLDVLAKQIRVRIEKGDKCINDSDGHYMAAGIDLIEARERCVNERKSWSAFLVGECHLGRSRAYELISVVEGRTTLAALRAKNSASKQRGRDAAKCPGHPGQSKSADPRISAVTKILKGAGDRELARWETFASERLQERTFGPVAKLHDVGHVPLH
jgi:hypothetical protein